LHTLSSELAITHRLLSGGVDFIHRELQTIKVLMGFLIGLFVYRYDINLARDMRRKYDFDSHASVACVWFSCNIINVYNAMKLYLDKEWA
jgi:hypothetical protein